MTLEEIMAQLEELGTEQTRKTFERHGANRAFYGVKVGDLKKLVKFVKKDHDLALALYETSNHDAMYLAGLAVDPKKMNKKTLQKWVQGAYWHMLAEYTVAGVAAESPFALELARGWIESNQELVAVAGWTTFAHYVSITPDEALDAAEIRSLLQRVESTIHQEKNRVRYAMNTFVICVGSYVSELHEEAIEIARKIGTVQVQLGQTACKVPFATDYIEKTVARGSLTKKKKTARC